MKKKAKYISYLIKFSETYKEILLCSGIVLNLA